MTPVSSQRCHWYVKSIGPVPVQVPGSATSVSPSTGARRRRRRAAGGGRVDVDARARYGRRDARAAGVAGGDLDDDRVIDVGGHERVGGVGGAGDVEAVRAVGVAALPLVGVGDRRRAGPGSVDGGQRLAVLEHAGDRRDERVDRRRGLRRSRLRRVAGHAAATVGRGHDDAQDVVDVAGHQRVGGVDRAEDVDAVGAVLVAALPLVGEVERRGAGPGAGVARSASRRRAGRR